ncbi:MAG: T9SS type A sorting domain-containing protein [Bacteroidota bacterium]|nr:T9SS type A sorting domain-containing protein [Bacteroidota bacterium]
MKNLVISILVLLLSAVPLAAQLDDGGSSEPILSHSPDPIDHGGVQLGESRTLTVSFTNIGTSVAKIKSIKIISESDYWTIEDLNEYPVEIHDGDWAFANNGTDKLNIDVSFAPQAAGISTAELVVSWGLYEDKVYRVPLVGTGLSCHDAIEAYPGENWAESRNSWFTYTADKFQMVYINTCHPDNTRDPDELNYDTWIFVYSDCQGTLISSGSELLWDSCAFTKLSFSEVIPMIEGETVKLFFAGWTGSPNIDTGFFFNIVPDYPKEGDVCESAIPLTLPVVNHFGTTLGFYDDYDMSPCNLYQNYMSGNDKVYSITLENEGYLTGGIIGSYGSIHILDKCPREELDRSHCKAYTSGPFGGEFEQRILAGSYYVIISTLSPPKAVDYLLNMNFRSLGTDDDLSLSSMQVYPNPTDGMLTVSINNTELKDITIELLNTSGQIVYRNEVKNAYNYIEEIDVSAFRPGVYYLRINNGEEVKIEKLFVQ